MDSLKMQVFDSIRNSKSGDAKLDELNLNVSRYFMGYLKKHEEAITRIEEKKNLYTKAGMEAEKQKARAKMIEEYEKEVGDKGSWANEIAEVSKRFDNVTTKEPIQVLIEEGRQREARSYIRECKKNNAMDKLAEIQTKFIDGDETIVNAVINSPFNILPIDGEAKKIGIEKMRLRTNPLAAQRLEALQNAENTYQSMKTFFLNEIGFVDDTIKAI